MIVFVFVDEINVGYGRYILVKFISWKIGVWGLEILGFVLVVKVKLRNQLVRNKMVFIVYSMLVSLVLKFLFVVNRKFLWNK